MTLETIKLILALVASVITVIAYIPYFKDLFAGKTKPHLYTWLVWGVTQGTASVALIKGGGNFAAISVILGAILVLSIFVLSFKYGTKNITKSDTIVLVLALLAIVVWWQLDSALIAVLMVSAIDGIGYIPTFRKTWSDPLSETPVFWLLMALAMIITIISSGEYNLLTVTYVAVLGVCNATVLGITVFRRKSIAR
jgi:hypothetical protein